MERTARRLAGAPLAGTIGEYTFARFKKKVEAFHGAPAPGILIGGYMVVLARSMLPPGTLFEALVETSKCLPDAVQLLTPCSTGNRRMKVVDLGRYALTLYDKVNGKGRRVSIDLQLLADWPEIRDWFMKLRPKREQDTDRLLMEIEQAGEAFLACEPVQIKEPWLQKESIGEIGICPMCREAYPKNHGPCCRGCNGGAPFRPLESGGKGTLSIAS